MNLNAITLAITRPGGVRSWDPLSLFTTGVNGVWYDPSDVNLTWRRNLLTYTEQFDNASWTKFDSSVTANAVVAPDGTQTADKLVASATNSTHAIRQIPGLASNSSANTFSFFAKAGEYQGVIYQNTNGLMVAFNCLTGARTGGDNVAYSITDSGNGWWRIAITHKLVGLDGQNLLYVSNLTNPGYASAYTGDGTSGIYIWGAQLEVGSTATPYQRITDGVQDYLQYQAQPVLYQDAAGTTPVTAVEQPVGLMLDKSKGLVLGPELVTNGDFSNGTTGWTTGTGLSVSVVSGQAQVTRSGGIIATAAFQNSVTVTSGKTYLVKIDVTTNNGAARSITNDPGTSFTGAANFIGTGTFTFIITATDTKIRINLWTDDGTTSTFDNISVRELPGNHAFNSSGNSANFSVLSARYNLLTKTEQFDDAVWSKSSVSLASGATDPNGGTSAFTLTATSNLGNIFQSGVRSGTFVSSIWIRRKSGSGGVQILSADGNVWVSVTVTSQWTRFEDTKTSTNLGGAGVRLSASGDAVDIAFADLRVSNDGVNLPAYQRVNTSTDYDTVGFKPYLKFNGTNQWLQTNSIDFSYGDKMFVCAGVRKLSDAATGVLMELGTGTPPGIFNVIAPNATLSASYSLRSEGTVNSTTQVTGFVAPITNVLSGIGNISGDQAILRVNGTQTAISTVDQGTGNYGNYPLYIGARAGTSLWFNGRLHQLVVAGKQASDSEITNTETFINQKTGAY